VNVNARCHKGSNVFITGLVLALTPGAGCTTQYGSDLPSESAAGKPRAPRTLTRSRTTTRSSTSSARISESRFIVWWLFTMGYRCSIQRSRRSRHRPRAIEERTSTRENASIASSPPPPVDAIESNR
jgi:hypothetical protein